MFPSARTFAACVVVASAGLAVLPASAQDSGDQATSETQAERYRNIDQWDLGRKNLAIEGYDPVAYFPEGGGKARKGDKDFAYTYKGVTYRFASAANRDLFRRAPDRYEPQYGGWCAWAMSKGTKTEINPKSFIVRGEKLFLFYDGLFGDTRADWEKGSHASLTADADAEWKDISGEDPHSAPAPDDD